VSDDDLPPEVIAALATLVRYITGTIRHVVIEVDANRKGNGFYDAKTAPMGRSAFLRLARQGAFGATKVGRRVIARKDDVDAWIASRTVVAPHRSTSRTARPATEEGDRDPLVLHQRIGDEVRPRPFGMPRRRA